MKMKVLKLVMNERGVYVEHKIIANVNEKDIL